MPWILAALACTPPSRPPADPADPPSDPESTADPVDTATEPTDTGDSAPEPPSVGRCAVSADRVDCAYDTLALDTGLLVRDVHHQVPVGEPPPDGWPAVVFFQGSFFSGELAFAGQAGDPFGQLDLARTTAALLDGGYAVIAPEALGEGATAWETNVPPMAFLWEGSRDDRLVDALLAAVADGTFGPIDRDRLFATGISSGGFMTSRMAVSYRGRFRALAIHSASYATCSVVCVVPPLPADHPPTLFLHGADDRIVPIGAMRPYEAALRDDGVDVRTVVVEDAGHLWLPDAVREVPAWFDAH